MSEDQNAKRRKRGSLFFRKKKDKSKKILHSWMSPPYSNFEQSCDWCAKPLENKPALSCESMYTYIMMSLNLSYVIFN
jgi:A-kinase anchor protein 18